VVKEREGTQQKEGFTRRCETGKKGTSEGYFLAYQSVRGDEYLRPKGTAEEGTQRNAGESRIKRGEKKKKGAVDGRVLAIEKVLLRERAAGKGRLDQVPYC